MRTFILFTFLFFPYAYCFAQKSDKIKLGDQYELIGNYEAEKCNGVGNNIGSSEILEREFVVTLDYISPDSQSYVISLIPFTYKNTDTIPKNKRTEAENYNERFVKKSEEYIYFLIPAVDFPKYFKAYEKNVGFVLGAPTVPAKIRFGNGGTGSNPRYFRFEGNLSLGISGGARWWLDPKRKQYALNIMAGFTIASVKIDSASTQGSVRTEVAAASFSPHIAFIFDVQKFQFGLFSGVDFLLGKPNSVWTYRNQPWLGIGIGYRLFNVEGEKKDKTQSPN